MVAIAGFTVLVWDHVVTFDDEVSGLGKVLCSIPQAGWVPTG